MADFDYNFKYDKTYVTGTNVGFFAAFLLFSSIFYFLIKLSNKIPKAVNYYHVLFFVVIAYLAGFLILKFRK